jgi:hypothetical protein
MYVLVYVDDFKLAGPKGCAELHTCVQWLKGTFGVRILPAEACLIGFTTTRSREKRTLPLSQPVYGRNLLAEYGTLDANAWRTRMDSRLQLQTAAPRVGPCTIEPCASLGGSLMFLANGIRPDIAQTVHVQEHFMANPRRSHWLASKRVLRYLAGRVECGLLFGGRDEREPGSCISRVRGWCDAD